MIADEATIRATLARLGVEETALGAPGATIARTSGAPLASVSLPSLSVAETETAGADLVARSVLGKGGMGLVRLATQRSLDRDVAVKTSLGGSRDAALLREARAMGRLEHPNIVPAHALGRGEDGAPVLVMKRVEGVSWATLLEDATHPAWAALLSGHGDRLRANVEILVPVCRALSFAHSRGVVHRDLKPENVMVGAFGEVLLLDWGLALRLDERDVEPPGIVGTPGYLPPEMAMGDPRAIDARTDVYLLGAVLYEILTGRMPHASATALGALASSLSGEIERPTAEAPHELAALAMAALGPRADRPESADAFRVGLTRFLASREADVLVTAARSSMAHAEVTIAARGLAAPDVLRPLVEARFALVSARAMRSDDAAIEAELERCLVRHVEREIALRNAAGARALLPELGARAQELQGALETLEAAIERERRDAERARRAEADADTSRMARTGVAALAMAVVTATAYFAGALGAPASSPLGQATWQALTLTAMGLIALVERRRLSSERSRKVVVFGSLWFSYGLGHALVGLWRGSPTFDWGAALVSGTLLTAVGALTLLPRLWPSVPVHAVACVASVVWPAHQMTAFTIMFWINAVIVIRALVLEIRDNKASA